MSREEAKKKKKIQNQVVMTSLEMLSGLTPIVTSCHI